jgi:hypothetical protein
MAPQWLWWVACHFQQKEGRVVDNQMFGVFLIKARITSKLITQQNAKEIIKNKFKNPSSFHSNFTFMLLHNRSLLALCRHLAASFLLWPKEPFRRRKRAKHVVHKTNNMSLHSSWTRGDWCPIPIDWPNGINEMVENH